MVDKTKLRQWAINAAAIIRGYPDLYCLAKRGYDRLTSGCFTRLKKIIEATSEKYLRFPEESESRGDVLFVSPRWWNIHQGWETIIAHILRRQGFRPHFLVCDHAMDMCDSYELQHKKGEVCPQCRRDITRFLELNRLPFSRYADWIDVTKTREEAKSLLSDWNWSSGLEELSVEGFPLGRLIRISVIRYLRTVRPPQEVAFREQCENFVSSGLLSLRVAEKILQKPWAFLFMVNGGFFAESIMIQVANRKNLPFFTYERGLKKDFVLLNKNDRLINFNVSQIFRQREELNEAENGEIQAYLEERKFGRKAVVNYWPEVMDDKARIRKLLGLNPGRKIFVAFPNITWDSAVLNREIFFPSLWEWLRQTIDHFRAIPDVHLIVRVHPAEVRLRQKSSERVADLIRSEFPGWQEYIKLVDADSPISSYALIQMADKVLVYTSTTGLEAAMMGKQVIVSARTHYRGMGFTTDPATREEYWKTLLETPSLDKSEIMDKARRNAYTLFFDTHIPFQSLSEEDMGFFHYNIRSLDDLFEGSYPEVQVFRQFPFVESPDGFLSYRLLKLMK